MDPEDNWDGGWGEFQDGGENADALLLGARQRYDSDGVAGGHRWGSRHQLISKRFADAVDPDTGAVVAAGARAKGLSAPKSGRSPTRATVSKAERDEWVAAQLGLEVEGLKTLRRRRHRAELDGPLPKGAARFDALEKRTGLAAGLFRALANAELEAPRVSKRKTTKEPKESRSSGPVGQGRKKPKRGRRRKPPRLSVRPSSAVSKSAGRAPRLYPADGQVKTTLCPGCGRAISLDTTQCGCS